MTAIKFTFITIIVSVLFTNYLLGQGCSDAGICTINTFKPHVIDSTKAFKNQFKVGTFFGNADKSIAVYGTYLAFNTQVNKKISLDAKLTSMAQNGNGIALFGLSDIFVNANF